MLFLFRILVGAAAGAAVAAYAGAAAVAEVGGAAVAGEVGGAAVAAEGGTNLTSVVLGGASGAGIFGGVYGFFSVRLLTRKYEEFKGETMKINSALQSLKGKQRKRTTQGKVLQKKAIMTIHSKQI